VGALAAALAQMVAGLTIGRPRYAHVVNEMNDAAGRAAALASELTVLVERDAAAYDAVAQAYKLPKGIGTVATARYGTLQRALIVATESPLAIAKASAAAAALSADIAERGNVNAVADAAVAALLADAVCRAAALIVRVNVVTLADTSIAQRFTDDATDFTMAASAAVARALSAVEREC
jgi:glutamate formiminotransferase/formiminotetrahydrofolate cyclodeaminase